MFVKSGTFKLENDYAKNPKHESSFDTIEYHFNRHFDI
jgi:hypothetical protein